MEPTQELRLEPPAPCKAHLRDGTEVLIRPLVPTDELELRMGLEHLSSQSRYQRFLVPIARLSDPQLSFLVHPDGQKHLALIMVAPREGEPGLNGMGVARCVRISDAAPETAEVAVTVADAFQRKGAGTLLVQHLARWALRCGVREWVGVLLGSNEGVKKALDQVGPRIGLVSEGLGVLRITWRLDPNRLASSSTTPARTSSGCP